MDKKEQKMKISRKLSTILLSIWLIVTGLLQIINLSIPGIGTILALLAIVAGALLLMER
jgi:hypothetical protein